jgi:hypothetical protein
VRLPVATKLWIRSFQFPVCRSLHVVIVYECDGFKHLPYFLKAIARSMIQQVNSAKALPDVNKHLLKGIKPIIYLLSLGGE